MPSQEDLLLGKIALHYKLVTQEALNAAVQRQGTLQPQPALGAVLLEAKVISLEQLKWLQQAQAQYLAKQGGGAAAPAPSAPRPSSARIS